MRRILFLIILSVTLVGTASGQPSVKIRVYSTDICYGEVAVLWLEVASESFYTVKWSDSSTNHVLAVWPDTDTDYAVTVRDTSGRITRDTIRITVSPRPDAGPDRRICSKDSVTIGTDLIPGYKYEWSPANGLGDRSSHQPRARPDSTTSYIMKMWDAKCTVYDTVTVHVPSATAAGKDDTICAGESVVIGSDRLPGHNYRWEPAVGLNNGDISNPQPKVSPNSTTSYFLTVTDISGCQYTDMVLIIVVPSPVSYASVDTICWGESATIGRADPGYYTYEWDSAPGLSDLHTNRQQVSPDSTTTYRVKVSGGDCQTQDSHIVVVRARPQVYVLRPSESRLTAILDLPGIIGYQWVRDGFEIPGAQKESYDIPGPGIYKVDVTDISGRKWTSAPYHVSLDNTFFIPDIIFPYGVAGKDKRMELSWTNRNNSTIIINGARFISDTNTCIPHSGNFSIVNAVEGLVLKQGKSARMFMSFTPETPGKKIERLVIDYSTEEGSQRNHDTVQVVGTCIPPGNYVTAKTVMDSIVGDSVGKITHLPLHLNVSDSLKELAKSTGNNPRFQITLSVPARLLHLISSDFDTVVSCSKFNKVEQMGQNEGELMINLFGTYTCDGSIEIPFLTTLGNKLSGMIIVLDLKWINLQTPLISVEDIRDTIYFELQGICWDENEGLRLIQPAIPRTKPAIKLIPNPAGHTLQIDYDLPAAGSADIAIYDLFGRTMWTSQSNGKVGVNTVMCNVEELAAGSYIIMLAASGNRAVTRLDITR